MKSNVENIRGHRAGHWFTTYKPESTSIPLDLFSSGANDLGEGALLVTVFAAYVSIVWAYRVVFRRKGSASRWDNYQGLVLCQIYNDDLRFFQTVRGTSRVVMKPPAFIRPLEALVKFQTITTSPPKLSFTFSDGFNVELYSSGDDLELTKFREVVTTFQSGTRGEDDDSEV